jgi:putative transcriptional regulator
MQADVQQRELRKVLQRSDFSVSEPHGLRSVSFDLVAKRGELILVAKCALNVCAIDRQSAKELKVLAVTLGGAPLIVGTHSGQTKLEDGAIFTRYGVPVLTIGTVKDLFIEGVPPYVFAGPGGLYVRIDKSALRRARERRVSIGELAEAAGVSRRAIQMYEEGMGAMLEAALRLERFLGEALILPVDPFVYDRNAIEEMENRQIPPQASGLHKEVYAQLGKLGYEIYPTARCPFDALTKERENLYITGVARDTVAIGGRAHVAYNIARIVERQSVIFTEGMPKRKNIEGSIVIGKSELIKASEPEELREMVKERKRRQ